MADKLLHEYGRTAASNGLGSAPDWPGEDWTSDQVNNFLRAFMAAAKLFYEDATFIQPYEGAGETWTFAKLSDTQFRLGGPRDVTGECATERRVRLNGSGGVVGWITAQSYSDPNTDVTVELDSGVVPATITSVELSLMALKRPAFTSFGTAAGEAVNVDDVATVIGQAVPLGTAATKDFGTEQDEVPQNSDLGTASLLDVGTGSGQIPTNADVSRLRTAVAISTETSNATPSAEWEVADWKGVAISGADGVKYFRVTLIGFFDQGYDMNRVLLRVGSLGTLGDPVLNQAARDDAVGLTNNSNVFASGLGSGNRAFFVSAIVQANSGDKVTVSCVNDSDAGTRQIRTNGQDSTPQKSLLIIEEI